jgi:hypothetical protein
VITGVLATPLYVTLAAVNEVIGSEEKVTE